jgi:hypothetical protein
MKNIDARANTKVIKLEDNINKLLLCFDSHFRLQVTSRKRQATKKVKHAS